MISTTTQFNNLIITIFITQIIITIALIWILTRYLLKKKQEEPSEKEIKKILEKDEKQE